MSDSGEDELPDLAIGNFNENKPYVPTKINVDEEIAENRKSNERRKQISLAKTEYEEKIPDRIKRYEAPEPKIKTLPPQRQIFDPSRSLISINQGNLTTKNFFPSGYETCTSENVDEFLSWVQSKLKTSSDDIKQQLLQYLWLLISCHSDPYVVQICCNTLVEHNSLWRLKYEEVVFVFYNWGVISEDIIEGLDPQQIVASLEPSQVVSPSNVECVLTVLNCQLQIQDLGRSETGISSKALFVFLILLPLDHNYLQCLPVVFRCLEQLAQYAESQNSSWLEDYCKEILRVECHHARVAFLLECVVPESMRWCLCLAYCQKVFAVKQTFSFKPEPHLLKDLLIKHTDEFLQLDSWDLYSLISIVDSGISCVINNETEINIKEGFQEWLSQYMIRRSERRANTKTEDIDVDAVLLAELVSRLQAEWESKWLAEPQDNICSDVEEH